jgi:hypothetical protein
MSTTKEHGVVMLEADSSPAILENTYIKESKHGISPLECSGTTFDVLTQLPKEALEYRGYKLHHLYLTSDEEIKEGDWYIDIYTECIELCPSKEDAEATKDFIDDYKKIIATTDPKLTFNGGLNPSEDILRKSRFIPKIKSHFIESYVKNPVDKVLLEYEWDGRVNYKDKPSVYNLKLVNNEVVVASKFNPERVSEEELSKNRIESYEPAVKLYTKEEVEIIALKAIKWANDLRCDIDRKAVFGGDSTKEVTELMDTDKWLKKNL